MDGCGRGDARRGAHWSAEKTACSCASGMGRGRAHGNPHGTPQAATPQPRGAGLLQVGAANGAAPPACAGTSERAVERKGGTGTTRLRTGNQNTKQAPNGKAKQRKTTWPGQVTQTRGKTSQTAQVEAHARRCFPPPTPTRHPSDAPPAPAHTSCPGNSRRVPRVDRPPMAGRRTGGRDGRHGEAVGGHYDRRLHGASPYGWPIV